MRGLAEWSRDETYTDKALWVAYSINKEDIWISRIPIPFQPIATKPVNDNFNDRKPGSIVRDWNIYSPKWATVSLVNEAGTQNRVLELRASDPFDYARAVRVFPAAKKVRVSFKVKAGQTEKGRLEIELLDARGRRPIQLQLSDNGKIEATTGAGKTTLGDYQAGRWLDFDIDADATTQTFSITLDGKVLLQSAAFAAGEGAVDAVERFSLRTGEYRGLGGKVFVNDAEDVPTAPAVFWIDDVKNISTG
jgi:hypothetical protein